MGGIFYNLMWIFINFINIFIFIIAFDFISNYNSDKYERYDIKRVTRLFVLGVLIFLFLHKNYYIISIIIGVIYAKRFYSLNIKISVLLSTLYWGLGYYLLDKVNSRIITILNITDNRLSGSNIIITKNMIDPNIYVMYFEEFIFNIIVLIVICLITMYIKKCKDIDKAILKMIFVPVVGNIASILVIYRYIAFEGITEQEMFIIAVISIFMVTSNIYIFFALINMIEGYRVRYTNKIMNDILKKEYEHYMDLDSEREKVKSIRHDIKNHLISIRGMADNKELNSIKNYIDNLYEDLDSSKVMCDTGNIVLNYIIRNKSVACIRKNIKLDVSIKAESLKFIKDTDMCMIFSNLFDNAIEACEKIDIKETRFINLKGQRINDMYVILMSNSMNNELTNLETYKKENEIHGYGLRNIKYAVNKNNGELNIEISDKVFTVKIMFII